MTYHSWQSPIMHHTANDGMAIDSVEENTTCAPVAVDSHMPEAPKPPVKPIKRIATILKENADLVLPRIDSLLICSCLFV